MNKLKTLSVAIFCLISASITPSQSAQERDQGEGNNQNNKQKIKPSTPDVEVEQAGKANVKIGDIEFGDFKPKMGAGGNKKNKNKGGGR